MSQTPSVPANPLWVALTSRARSARDLIDTADQAMYRAKPEGRGPVVVKNPDSAPVPG